MLRNDILYEILLLSLSDSTHTVRFRCGLRHARFVGFCKLDLAARYLIANGSTFAVLDTDQNNYNACSILKLGAFTRARLSFCGSAFY